MGYVWGRELEADDRIADELHKMSSRNRRQGIGVEEQRGEQWPDVRGSLLV